eukprot:scaffold81970_cov71-Phaeocystis_antarctica.AAC.3
MTSPRVETVIPYEKPNELIDSRKSMLGCAVMCGLPAPRSIGSPSSSPRSLGSPSSSSPMPEYLTSASGTNLMRL